MATDLSNKEIEDGIKKILFSKDNNDFKCDPNNRGKTGKSTENQVISSDVAESTTASPRKQKRNRDRPRNKYEKGQGGKSLSEEKRLDEQKVSQGKSASAQDRVESHQRKDGTPSMENKPTQKGMSQMDANGELTDRPACSDSKRKRNRGKKKKRACEGNEVKASVDGSVRPKASPSPKPVCVEKSKKISKVEEAYKQNLAGLASKTPQLHQESNQSAAENLEKEYIYPLKKRSLKFPTAKFFCRLCEYHCDSVGICERHVKDARHLRLKTIKTTDILLKSLPSPSGVHLEAINKLVDSVYKEHALLDEQLQLRIKAFDKIEEMLKKIDPEMKCSLYGSTLTGLALTDSDINVDITMDKSPKVLLQAHQMMKDDTSGFIRDVKSDFSAKVPCIYLTLCESGALCQIAINNSQSVKTSQLLAIYAQLDPRVKPLVVLFRLWAKLCKIDNQEAGTLPAYVFSILVVYFLQQLQPPILPVLHELVPQSELKPGKPGNEHIYLDDVGKVKKVWQTRNKMSLGELWIRLLKFYAVQFDVSSTVVCIRQSQPLARQEKKWASKKLAIEDPFSRRRNVARTLSHSQVFEYINDRIRSAYQYFGIPQTQNGPIYTEIDPAKLAKELEEKMRCLGEKPNTPDVNERRKATNVSIKRLEETVNAAVPSDNQTSVAGKTPLVSESIPNGDLTKETSSNLAIAFNSLASLCKKTIASQSMEKQLDTSHSPDSIAKIILDDLIVAAAKDCIPSSGLGQGAPVPTEGGLVKEELKSTEIETKINNLSAVTEGHIVQQEGLSQSELEESSSSPSLPTTDNSSPLVMLEKQEAELSASSEEDTADNLAHDAAKALVEADGIKGTDTDDGLADADVVIEEEFEEEEIEEEDETGVQGRNTKYTLTKTSKFIASTDNTLLTPRQASPDKGLFDESLLQGLNTEDLIFKFDAATLSDSKGPAVMCGVCQREGHLKMNCPDERLPDLEPLPKMTRDFRKMLDQVLRGVPKDFEPSHHELMMRQQVLQELENFIRETYPDAGLSLFGSSCNGFGFRYSDLDICLTFDGHATTEGLNCVEIIEVLAKKLKKHRGLYNVFAITTAKVPIVKFKHRRYQLDGDISLYNTLAQHNTRMLRMYADVDPRVKVLGYVMKVFAKCCDICDASRGSLSSYAYSLMVLYFLQQRKPPVIPVLQELYEGKKPECIVDGWNAWFYEDFPSLPKTWPGYGKNQESVGELWVGLLRFYTEEFNFLDYTISIRHHKPITRFEKLWNGKCIAIEDPFDHSHNLGSGLSRRMNTYILKAFRKGRLLFGTPFEFLPRGCATLQDYFFNADNLTEGQPPNDRGCRICGKIGHFAKECPVVQQKKEWKERDHERRRAEHEDDESRKGLEGSSLHAGSKPQAIPRDRGYQRSQSYGHTPPEMCSSPGSGPNSLPGNLAFSRGPPTPGSPSALQGPQVFYNTNFRGPDHGYGRGNEVQNIMGYTGGVADGRSLPVYMGLPQSPSGTGPTPHGGTYHLHGPPPGSPAAPTTTAFPAFYYHYVPVANHAASTNAIDTNTNTERGPYRKSPYYPAQSQQYYQQLDWTPGRQGGGGNQSSRGRQTQSPGRGQARSFSSNNSNNFEITVPNERFQGSQSAEFRDKQSNAQYHQGNQNQGKKGVGSNPTRATYNTNSQRFNNR